MQRQHSLHSLIPWETIAAKEVMVGFSAWETLPLAGEPKMKLPTASYIH